MFFCNSGAEANEAAIKLVRKARPRGDVVVAHDAFHGRTYGALSATPQEAKQAPFAPLVPGLPRGRRRDEIAGGGRREHRRGADRADPGRVRREPAGAASCWPSIRAACDAVGAALVFDEVQTGMGRTGSLWAYEQLGVVPGRDDAGQGPRRRAADRRAGHRAASCADVFAPGDHGSTFAGGPVVSAPRRTPCSTSSTTRRSSRGVRERGERLLEGLRELPGVVSARGRGLMVAAEVDGDAPDVATRALLEQRLIINATGPTTLRFLPPLIVTDAEIDDALARLARSCFPDHSGLAKHRWRYHIR